MEETPQSKDGTVKDQGVLCLAGGGAGPDSKIQGAEQTTIGVLEAIEVLPESVRKQTMLLSRAHYAEAEAMSKKLKRSTSGEVTSSTDGVDIPPTPPLKLNADDPLKLNVGTQGSFAAIGESNRQVSGYTLLRMLIPADCDGMVDKNNVTSICGQPEAEIRIYHVTGVNVVMVWAKDDPLSSTSPAVEGFLRVHEHFLDKLPNYFPPRAPYRLTRLLIPADQAKSLLRSDAFCTSEESRHCFRYVYLSDNVSILSDGDVIIELQGIPKCVNNAVREIAYHLRKSPVGRSMIFELQNKMLLGTPQKNISGSSSPVKHSKLKAKRIFEIHFFTGIEWSDVDDIMGANCENIEKIQQSTSASISLAPSDCGKVLIQIDGESTEEAEEAKRLLQSIIGKRDFFNNMLDYAVSHESPERGAPSSDRRI